MIGFILALIVVVTVAYGATVGFGGVKKSIENLFGGLAEIKYEDLSTDVQKKINDNFDSLISELKNCEAKNNCFCGKKAGFPVDMPKGVKIVLQGREAGLYWEKQKIKSEQINENFYLNTLVSKAEITFEEGYYADGKKGFFQEKRPAFYKSGKGVYEGFFVFNEDIESSASKFAKLVSAQKLTEDECKKPENSRFLALCYSFLYNKTC